MGQSDKDRFIGLGHGDMIRGETIYIQARKIECHKKPRSYSTHGRNTAEAKKSAEAWIVKKLRFQGKR